MSTYYKYAVEGNIVKVTVIEFGKVIHKYDEVLPDGIALNDMLIKAAKSALAEDEEFKGKEITLWLSHNFCRVRNAPEDPERNLRVIL